MSRRRLPCGKQADRALCPVLVSNAAGMRVAEVAAAMRAAGVSGPLTVHQVRAWRSMTETPPDWFVTLQASVAAGRAQRADSAARTDAEREHEELVLADKVEKRLLAGAKHFRSTHAEHVASDYAVRAMKDLVRAGGDTSLLNDLDLAALRWAGVDPTDHASWFLHGGGCCGGN